MVRSIDAITDLLWEVQTLINKAFAELDELDATENEFDEQQDFSEMPLAK